MQKFLFKDIHSIGRKESGELIEGKLTAYTNENISSRMAEYFTDGKRVYLECKNFAYIKDRRLFFLVKDAEVTSFRALSHGYARDKHRVFFHEKTLLGADAEFFEALLSGYGRDKNAVYWMGRAVLNASVASFISLGWNYAKDKRQIYDQGRPLLEPRFDPESFIVLSEAYIKDNKKVYWYDKAVFDADVSTFQAVNNNYAKDRNRVYLQGRPFDVVDVETFEIIQDYWSYVDPDGDTYVAENWYTKDLLHVYYYRTRLADADSATFTLLSDGYAKDKYRVYFNDKVIKEADASHFIVIDKYYSTDGVCVFYNKAAKDAMAPFCYVESEYDVDFDRVIGEDDDIYYLDNTPEDFYIIVAQADLSSFESISDGYARDKNGEYSEGKRVIG